MRVLLTVLTLFFLSIGNPLFSQNLKGLWTGELYQGNAKESFYYQLTIEQEGDQLFGESFSKAGMEESARFSFTGLINNNQVIIQEITQLAPATPKWCLKYIILQLVKKDGQLFLEGDWKADGCVPGKIYLTSKNNQQEILVQKEVPFSIFGKWTGYLSQSDRSYGFFYEFELKPKASKSRIVSEGNGGNAFISMDWAYDSLTKVLKFNELEVLNKTDEQWRWCIKSANLNLTRKKNVYVLEGNWKGYIEGHDLETGSCAPGKMYLEKPILTNTVSKAVENMQSPYESSNARKVKVQRVLEVSSPKLKIRVWDNGTVDGDVATLILNGKTLFNKYRVSKTRYARLATLNQENNFLILHAEDLGDISPNTVAVSVDDGTKEQIIILSSNLKESGAVLIKQFKVNE